MNNTIVESADLYFREGNSDKVYHASIQEQGDGYVVFFSYGRRGGNMTEGYKIDFPAPLNVAKEVFDKLVASKTKKGYRHG